MKELDVTGWERREIYDFMTKLSDPFYTVCFNVDVTDVYEYAHANRLSFYYSMIYLVTKAINRVPAFLNDIVDGKIMVLDRRDPSFCDIRKDSEAFYIVNVLLNDDIKEFCRIAREKSASQTTLFPAEEFQNEAWIYFSCIPWLDITCITNERDFDPDDTVPRISWGKYTECAGRKKLNMSMEVNHRFIDGYHIGQFEKKLTEEIRVLSSK